MKVSRLIRRRTVANQACDADRVLVNGKSARASYAVKVGDVITLTLGAHTLRAKVLSIAEHARKEDAPQMYIIINDE